MGVNTGGEISSSRQQSYRDPGKAVLWGLVAGGGQIYNGKTSTGFIVLYVCVACPILLGAFGVFLASLIGVGAMFSAYFEAKRINEASPRNVLAPQAYGDSHAAPGPQYDPWLSKTKDPVTVENVKPMQSKVVDEKRGDAEDSVIAGSGFRDLSISLDRSALLLNSRVISNGDYMERKRAAIAKALGQWQGQDNDAFLVGIAPLVRSGLFTEDDLASIKDNLARRSEIRK